MTPRLRSLLGASAVVLLLAVAAVTYLNVTGTPAEVERAALTATQREDEPGIDPDDEFEVSCADPRGEKYICIVVLKQVDRLYADGPADYCLERRVVVDDGRAGQVVPIRQPDGRDFRSCR